MPADVVLVKVQTPTNQQSTQLMIRDNHIIDIIQDTVTGPQSVPHITIPGSAVQHVSLNQQPVSLTHWLGTDMAGRDVLTRSLAGGRMSLLVAAVATIVSVVIGVTYGAVAGWLGGRWERLMMRLCDIGYSVPFMFLVILLLVSFGRNIIVLFAALGAVQWLTMARIVRAQVGALKQQPFIQASRLAGRSTPFILSQHIIPNCLGPIIIYATLTVPLIMLEESFLAFIGLQVQIGARNLDSWGSLIKYGIDHAGEGYHQWWLLVVPAGLMAATLLALNICGAGIRDACDPQQNITRNKNPKKPKKPKETTNTNKHQQTNQRSGDHSTSPRPITRGDA